MSEVLNADGLVIISARIRDPFVREEFRDHLHELLGERVNPTTYELNIADWDDGLWEEEVEWISELLDGTGESVVVWRFRDGEYVRLRLGSH